jgi:hypothetical protein
VFGRNQVRKTDACSIKTNSYIEDDITQVHTKATLHIIMYSTLQAQHPSEILNR